MNQVWKVRNYDGKYSDEQLIKAIQDGQLKPNDYITTKELKTWIRIKDSIYQIYLKGDNKNETL